MNLAAENGRESARAEALREWLSRSRSPVHSGTSGPNPTVNSTASGPDIAEELARRIRWFESYVEALNLRSVVAEAGSGPYACPCCRHPTLEARGQFEVCSPAAGRTTGRMTGRMTKTHDRLDREAHI